MEELDLGQKQGEAVRDRLKVRLRLKSEATGFNNRQQPSPDQSAKFTPNLHLCYTFLINTVMDNPEDFLVTRRSRRSTAGNR